MSETSETPQNPTKQEVLDLMKEKDKLEEELKEWIGVLESQGVSMDDTLVDDEGFPRNDIDVAQVRQARNRIICIKNDLKAIMKAIESGIHSLHAQSREAAGPSDEMEVSREDPKLIAFAVVDSVAKGSPAERAGLKEGDRLVFFGSVNHGNFNGNMKAVGDVVEHSLNSIVRLQVIRDLKIVNLTLRPQKWAGKGYLGCLIKPIEDVIDR